MSRVARLLLAVAALWGSRAAAGAWIRPPGGTYVKASLSHYRSSESYGGLPGAAYDSTSLSVYAEIGLPFQLQLTADLPLVIASQSDSQQPRRTQAWLGDARVSLERGLLQLPLSVGLEVKVPLYRSLYSRSQAGYVELGGELVPLASAPEIGDGNVDLTPRLLWGLSLHPFPGWLAAEAGYRWRLGGFGSGLYFAASGGAYLIEERLGVGVWMDAVKNLGVDLFTREFVHLQIFILAKAPEHVPGWHLTAGAGVTPLIRNGGRGFDLTFSVAWER